MDYSVFKHPRGVLPKVLQEQMCFDDWWPLATRTAGNTLVRKLWGVDRHAPTHILQGAVLEPSGVVYESYTAKLMAHDKIREAVGRLDSHTFQYLQNRICKETRLKASKKLLKHLAREGFDVTSKWVQDVLMEWAKKFTSRDLRYEVLWDPEDFHRLATFIGVDTESCYRKGSEYWPDAPTTLAEHMYEDKMTFIVLIYEKDSAWVGARCWGWYDPNSEGFVISNGYYGPGMIQDISIFRRAVEAAIGKKSVSYEQASSRFVQVHRMYVNGDMQLCALKEDGLYPSPLVGGHYCLKCSDYTKENHGFYHALCSDCSSEIPRDDMLECIRCGDCYDEGDEGYCDRCGSTMCPDCYEGHAHCEHPRCNRLAWEESEEACLCERHWEELKKQEEEDNRLEDEGLGF